MKLSRNSSPVKSAPSLLQRGLKLFNRLWPKDDLAKAAFYTLLASDAVDIISTIFVISLVASAHETNPFMVDSLGNFLVWKAIKVKALGFCWAGLFGYGIQRSTGFKWAFALPFLYFASTSSLAAMNNFLIYVSK